MEAGRMFLKAESVYRLMSAPSYEDNIHAAIHCFLLAIQVVMAAIFVTKYRTNDVRMVSTYVIYFDCRHTRMQRTLLWQQNSHWKLQVL